MKSKEIIDIKNKNSQEILLYLQKKEIKKNNKYLFSDFRKKFPDESIEEENNGNNNLPKTRMKQFLNKSFFTYEGKKTPSKSLSNDTNEQTPMMSTPKFIEEDNSPVQINVNKKYSQFSFSNENNENEVNNPDSLNYLDFHLQENIDKFSKNSGLNNDRHYHIYLPKKYKDNEEYKARLYKYLKSEKRNLYSYLNNGIKTKNISPKKNILSKMPKIKKLSSVKNKDMNKIIFFDNNEEKRFNLYRDENIGIDKDWQLSAFYQNFDHDVESDEEQIKKGKYKLLEDLKMGIVRWSQNKNNCFNYKIANYSARNENIKRFSLSV